MEDSSVDLEQCLSTKQLIEHQESNYDQYVILKAPTLLSTAAFFGEPL